MGVSVARRRPVSKTEEIDSVCSVDRRPEVLQVEHYSRDDTLDSAMCF